ncbi:YggT family protein [Candidatus Gracilibacteria bacterium]|nr:YggT family protein [Candidatus Gracilibacteria bacterium]
MTIIILSLVIFLELIMYLVIFDIILSWLSLAGVNFRPRFISDIIGPVYKYIRKYIPTRFGAFDFTPIIILLGISFIKGMLLMNNPEVNMLLDQLIR